MTIIPVCATRSSWPFVGPAVVVLIAFGEIGGASTPPALDVAIWSFGAAAVLLTIKLLSSGSRRSHASVRSPASTGRLRDAHVDRRRLVRRRRVGARTAVRLHRRRAEHRVEAERRTIVRLDPRLCGRAEPSRAAAPRPATWNEDEAAFARYEDGNGRGHTSGDSGSAPALAHDVLRQLGVRDRDLDVFYAHPANAFQMRIVGTKLAALAARVPGSRA